jgi:hypothetical protein
VSKRNVYATTAKTDNEPSPGDEGDLARLIGNVVKGVSFRKHSCESGHDCWNRVSLMEFLVG